MCWVSATPLLDVNDNVGVWMVVIIDEKTAASNRGRLPDALSKRPDGTVGIHAQIQSLDQTRDVGDDDTEQKDIDGMQTPGLEPETLDVLGQAPQSPKTQRSGSITEKNHTIANGDPTESTNGSRMSSPAQSPSRTPSNEHTAVPNGTGGEKAPTTPPGTEIENESDLTPRQSVSRRMEGQSAKNVGLRAMDYLSSRSSPQQLQARESAGDDREGTEDLSAALPYSVD